MPSSYHSRHRPAPALPDNQTPHANAQSPPVVPTDSGVVAAARPLPVTTLSLHSYRCNSPQAGIRCPVLYQGERGDRWAFDQQSTRTANIGGFYGVRETYFRTIPSSSSQRERRAHLPATAKRRGCPPLKRPSTRRGMIARHPDALSAFTIPDNTRPQRTMYCCAVGNRTYFIKKAILSCYQTVAQIHERLPITEAVVIRHKAHHGSDN